MRQQRTLRGYGARDLSPKQEPGPRNTREDGENKNKERNHQCTSLSCFLFSSFWPVLWSGSGRGKFTDWQARWTAGAGERFVDRDSCLARARMTRSYVQHVRAFFIWTSNAYLVDRRRTRLFSPPLFLLFFARILFYGNGKERPMCLPFMRRVATLYPEACKPGKNHRETAPLYKKVPATAMSKTNLRYTFMSRHAKAENKRSASSQPPPLFLPTAWLAACCSAPAPWEPPIH